MRAIILLLLCVTPIAFSQVITPKKNYFLYNLGNSTPIIGVNYLRGFAYSKPDKPISHFEYGIGLGIRPFNNSPSNSELDNITLSHNLNYVRGKGHAFWTAGYNGIFAKEDLLFGNYGIYTPNPFVGFRLEYDTFVWNLNFNGYYYRDKSKVILEENNLYERITGKFITLPGVSVGWKF